MSHECFSCYEWCYCDGDDVATPQPDECSHVCTDDEFEDAFEAEMDDEPVAGEGEGRTWHSQMWSDEAYEQLRMEAEDRQPRAGTEHQTDRLISAVCALTRAVLSVAAALRGDR